MTPLLKPIVMKHYHIVFIAALIGSLSTSCKIGKKYTRPELNLPTTIIDTNRTDTTTVADIQWPAIYTDTVLQRLINTALAYNKNLLAAAARVKESRYAHRMEKANLFPGIDADALGAREYDRSPGNTFNIEATLSWELDLWGKLRWSSPAWQPISKPWKEKGPCT